MDECLRASEDDSESVLLSVSCYKVQSVQVSVERYDKNHITIQVISYTDIYHDVVAFL